MINLLFSLPYPGTLALVFVSNCSFFPVNQGEAEPLQLVFDPLLFSQRRFASIFQMKKGFLQPRSCRSMAGHNRRVRGTFTLRSPLFKSLL